jgi:uncharacterized protein YdeI (YjbR/CyaY-like superfamily)
VSGIVPASPEFFPTPEDLSAWFEANPEAAELWVGFWKKGFERPGITYSEAVDEALCNGWIDSVVRRFDEACYMLRFTPRRPRSTWTDTNRRRVAELRREGRMRPGGESALLAAGSARKSPKR